MSADPATLLSVVKSFLGVSGVENSGQYIYEPLEPEGMLLSGRAFR